MSFPFGMILRRPKNYSVHVVAESETITLELLLKAAGEDHARKDQNPIDQAEMLKALKDEGMTVNEMVENLGFTEGHINNLLRLLSLPPTVLAMVKRGELKMAMARSILGLRGLGLSDEELDQQMIQFAKRGCEASTCKEFEGFVKAFKQSRLGAVGQYRHKHEQGWKALELLRQLTQNLTETISDMPDDPELADAVGRILEPLLPVIQTSVNKKLKLSQESALAS